MAIQKGNTISVSDWDAVLAAFNTYWNDDVPTATFAQVSAGTVTNAHLGWGQPPAEPEVSVNDIIGSLEYNRLAAQINAALIHLKNNTLSSRFVIPVATGQIIKDDHLQGVLAKISSTIAPEAQDAIVNRDSGISLASWSEVTASNNAMLWQTSISQVVKVTFPSYREARYFFNSGGAVTFQLSATGGTDGSDDWQGVFENVGMMRLTAHGMTNNVPGDYDLPQGNPVFNYGNDGGFYNLSTTEATIASVTGYDSAVNYGDYGDYGDPGIFDDFTTHGTSSGLYNQRSVEFSTWATETASEFSVYVRTTLLEVEHALITNTDITLDVGYELPGDIPDYTGHALTDPLFMAPATLEYFKAGNYIYQFQERTPPTITLYQAWTGS